MSFPKICAAQALASESMAAVAAQLRCGMTEADIAAKLEAATAES